MQHGSDQQDRDILSTLLISPEEDAAVRNQARREGISPNRLIRRLVIRGIIARRAA